MYSTADLCQLTGLSRQRIAELRKLGRLVKGTHWRWNEGEIEYDESALDLLRKLPGAGRPPKGKIEQ